MLILSKKRITVMLCIIFISLYAFTYRVINNNSTQIQNMQLEKTVETVSTPVSNKVVIVDAGHGTPDEGAESNNGTTEAEINLKIVLKLQTLLEQSGCTVLLTRSDENAIYDAGSDTIREKKVSDMHNRVKLGNESSADVFVSIHLNKIPQQQYDGWQTFYKKNNEDIEHRVNRELEEKYEVGEDSTKYGEFISSYFAWVSLPNQKERAEELDNMTKTENDKNKRKNEK